MDYNPESVANFMSPSEASPDITQLATTIKDNASSGGQNSLKSHRSDFNPKNDYFFDSAVPNEVKGALEVKNYNIDDAYATLSDGSYIARYDTYKQGRDNANYAAQTQTTTDKWVNGLAKFGTKTLNAVIGGTAGVVYGVGKMASDGSLSSLYDNEFSRTLDDWNTKLDYKLPNYYTEQEQNANLFGQATTANFWADKVLGGLSFTAGAIISEGIWAYATGGTSLATTGARWGTKTLGFTRVAEGLNTYKSLLKNPLINAYRAGNISKTTAIALGRAGDIANTFRFALTSAGYEASVEALQYKKEATENFYGDFENLNGRQPNQEEIKQFESNLNSSANAVFGWNMGIVGTSNLVTLGKIFDLKNPIKTGIGEFIEKKAFGRGATSTIDDAGKIVYSPITATTRQKVARTIFDYGKSPLTEGLYEEGLQGVTTKVANKWIEHSYNPQFATENVEAAGLVYESLAEQYGTKEGWVDIGVGMIIGALGGVASARSGNRRSEQEIELQIAGLNTFQGGKVIAERMLLANRTTGFSQEAAEETQKGNIVKSRIATDGVLHSRMNHAYQLGQDVNDLVTEAQAGLNGMTTEQFKQAGVAPEQIEDFKKEVVQEYANTAKQFKQNRKYAEYVLGTNPIKGINEVLQSGEQALNNQSQESLIQSLTWTLTAGENASRLMKDVKDQIATQVGQEQSNVLNTVQQLSKQRASRRGQLTKTVNKRKALTEERDRLQKSLIELQNAPKETEGDRVAGRELGQLNLRLLDLENQISGYDTEIQSFTDELNSQKEYGQGVNDVSLNQVSDFNLISPEDLINLDENLGKFRNLVESYRTVSPQRHQYLTDLLDEYNQAHDIFDTNQSTALAISSGALKIKNLNTWLSKKLSKGATLNEVTRDWLVDILQKYEANKVASLSETTETEDPITDEQWEAFQAGNTPQEVIDSLIAKTNLSEREQAIYEANKEDIDAARRETPVVNPSAIVVQSQLSPTEILKERLENLLKTSYNSLTYIGSNYDDVSLAKPTRAEIEEYRNTKDESLRVKLGNWRLLDSAVTEDNQSIADLIDLIEQLETNIEAENTQDEIQPEDVATIVSNPEEIATNSIVRYDLAQNTKGSVTVKRTQEGLYRFSHLKMSSILSTLGIPFNSERLKVSVDGKVLKKVTAATFDNYRVGTVFYLDNTKIVVGSGNTLDIKSEDYQTLRDALNLHIVVPNIKWSYFDVYETVGDVAQKKPSDFQEDIFPEQIYEIQPEDNLTVEIANDSFNESLRNRVLNEEMTPALEKEILNQLKLYISHKGQPVSVLKALNNNAAPNDKFLLLREAAKQAFINNPVSPQISAKVKTRKIFLGSPQITTENLSSVNIELTDSAIEKVIATGYIQNGEVVLSREIPNVDRTYTTGFKNKEQKIPVIVFRKGKYNVAYPVSLKKTSFPVEQRITSITDNQTLSPTEKIKAINEQIIETGIATDKRLTEYDQNKIDAIIEDFATHQTFVSMAEFSNANYRLSNAKNDVLINIDLDNLGKTISDPKLELDLDSIELSLPRKAKFDSLIEVEDRLSDLSIQLNNDYTQNAQTKYVRANGQIIEDTIYTNVFDEGRVFTEPQNYLQKVANINALNDAFSEKLPKEVKNALSNEVIQEVEYLLKKRSLFNSQISINKERIVPNNSITDNVFENFAESTTDDPDIKQVGFMGANVNYVVTDQYDSFKGVGASFNGTWNVAKYNQGTFAHVRILMTEVQKKKQTKSDQLYSILFHENLKDLAKRIRTRSNVVILDIRNAETYGDRVDQAINDNSCS